MIFALRDYLRYREQSAGYRNDPGSDIMAAGFIGCGLERALHGLPPGTLLLVKTMRSKLSWLVLYITNAQVSHVAVYAGRGMIVHATTAGMRFESVQTLYGTDNRIVLFVPTFPIPKDSFSEEDLRDLLGAPYG